MSLTLIISIISFLAVGGLVGLLAFVFRDTTPKTTDRLDMLIGKKRKRRWPNRHPQEVGVRKRQDAPCWRC